ncbi:MAG TPA: tetratricopeptide repeat protein [Pirellulales bacterium]|nr:tetratricopeptide repeat protein [Pirellulales bacterium]
MARWGLLLAPLLALAAGCGDSHTGPTQKGSAYLRTGYYDEAIATLTDALAQNPRDADALVFRGRAYHYRGERGDLERAIEDFTAAMRLAPRDPEPYYCRSLVYRDHGELDKSQKDEELARKLDPRVSEVYEHLPEKPVAADRALPTTPQNAVAESADSSDEDPLSATKAGSIDKYRRANKLESPSTAERTTEKKEEPLGAADSAIRRAKKLKAKEEAQERLAAEKAEEESRRQAQQLPTRRAAAPDDEEDSQPAPGVLTDRFAPRPVPGAAAGPRRAARYTRPNEPLIPTSPWQPRSPYSTGPSANLPGASAYQSPYQSPYAPRTPRPTGFVGDNSPQAQDRPAPRQLYDRPYSAPTVRPNGVDRNSDLSP